MAIFAFAENTIQLVPDGTIFIHIAIILVMVFVLNKTLFKPINRILEERDKKTKGRSGEAHDLLARVEAKASEYERSLRAARSEGYRLLEENRSSAMTDRQTKLDLVREEISELMTRQKQAITFQARDARSSIESEARTLAAEIGTRILRRPVRG